ncbi:MAG: 6,7-dimethyl-8-ribityllumazine synthase [Bacteroidales bacterium]|nr:6,7-dimethyl-8-ribityllumazine synthase [Bacteroidales bacterium]
MEKKVNLSEYELGEMPDCSRYKIGVITAEWNGEITQAMRDGAVRTLGDCGVRKIYEWKVPGTFELSGAANMILEMHPDLDAVICIGCVIQGETRHFDFICEAVANGLTEASIKHNRTVVFSVLTTNDMQQARERSGGRHGNKGVEGAVTALKMVALQKGLFFMPKPTETR